MKVYITRASHWAGEKGEYRDVNTMEELIDICKKTGCDLRIKRYLYKHADVGVEILDTYNG